MFNGLGDFQTPSLLVDSILACLYKSGKHWNRVLEPTCGKGNFIRGLLARKNVPGEIKGIELQEEYVRCAKMFVQSNRFVEIDVTQENIFDLHLGDSLHWTSTGPLLVIGNPPWVTNTALSAINSTNLPGKRNIKNLAGFDALTGSSNFDIAEFIWLKLILELINECPTIALLCKTLVARNVLEYAAANKLPISNSSIRRIDSKEWFGVSVDACLFSLDVNQGETIYEIATYDDLESVDPVSVIGIHNGRLFSNASKYYEVASIDGKSPIEWRTGLKHDAASVVELWVDANGMMRNKGGEIIEIEDSYVFPLLKSSDLSKQGSIMRELRIVVPQTRFGENVHSLEQTAPKLWHYLERNKFIFDMRKSSIYRNQPPFAYFGLGMYSFAPYKVAISGLYKASIFKAVGPKDYKPVMFDDTCYFFACKDYMQCALITALLNHPLCQDFIQSIVFWDAKRPITKKLLQRIDLFALLRCIERSEILHSATQIVHNLIPSITCSFEQWPSNLESLLYPPSQSLVNVSDSKLHQLKLL